MCRVVLGLMLEQGAWQLLQSAVGQAEAFEDGVASHADNPGVVCGPRAEQALPQISDQCASCLGHPQGKQQSRTQQCLIMHGANDITTVRAYL